jgi:hypothetical protein
VYGSFIDGAQVNDQWKRTGSFLMIIAAVFMPLINFLCIKSAFFQNFFFIPTLSFAGALTIMTIGQMRRLG